MIDKTVKAIDSSIARMVQSVLSPAPSLAAEVDRLGSIRRQTLTILGHLTQQQAVWIPRSGAWSIAQIADHLLRTEELYREQFGRLLRSAREGRGDSIHIPMREVDASLAFIPREVMGMLETPVRVFNMFVPHAIRETMVRYPVMAATNPKASEPRPGLRLDELHAGLAASYETTRRMLTEDLPANAERLTIDHAVMGKNTLPQMAGIVAAHEERHQGQIAEVKGTRGFPMRPA